MFPLLCTSLLPYCWLCSVTSAAQGTETCSNAQVAKGFLLCEACGLLMSCLLPAHVRTLCLLAAGTCWSMESEQSRAEGGQELTVHAAADFWSISFCWAALASLRAIWNLVFVLFWQRQQHLELFEYPFLQLHLNVFLIQGRPGVCQPLLQPLSCASLPSPQLPVHKGPTVIQPSCVTLLRVLEKKLWESLER